MSEHVTIGFSRPKGFSILSTIIRWVEGTKFDHTYLRIYSKSLDRWLIYHASKTSLHFSNWESIQANNVICEEYELPIFEAEKVKILQYCVDNLEKPYGVLELIGIGWVRLARALGYKIKNPFSDGLKTEVCSEVVGHVLKMIQDHDDGPFITDEQLETEGPKFIRDEVAKWYV